MIHLNTTRHDMEPVMPLDLTIQRLGWKLVRNDGRGDVRHGDRFLMHNHTGKVTVTGGTPPMSPSSTGRIVVMVERDDGSSDDAEFYPGVCDLSWVRL